MQVSNQKNVNHRPTNSNHRSKNAKHGQKMQVIGTRNGINPSHRQQEYNATILPELYKKKVLLLS